MNNILEQIKEDIRQFGHTSFVETEELEYEQHFVEKQNPEYLKLIVGMANCNGGCILFGVKAKHGGAIAIGLHEDSLLLIDRLQKNYQRIIDNDYLGSIELRFEKVHSNNKTIVAVLVEKSLDKVITIKDGKMLVRDGIKTVSRETELSEKQRKELLLKRLIRFTDINRFAGYNSLSNYKVQEGLSRKQYVYKYMSLEGFIQCIEKGTIMFQEPIGWDDQFEKRFYRADYQGVSKNDADSPKMYATCTTIRRDNEAAWKVYVRGKSGLESKCVQLKIDLKQFRESLDQFASVKKYKVYEGRAFYDLYEKTILELHERSSKWYNIFFKSFNLEKFIALHLLKRPAFAYEEEMRFFMVPEAIQTRNKNARKADKLFVKVPWANLIKEIRIDKKCSESEILALRAVCEDKGIELTEKTFKPRTIIKPVMKIPVELFDIDRMPGKRKITIQ